jgi:hypothetical protein
VTLFRHADPRFPFLWESRDQPSARWNAGGEGPVQYLADTADGAWAEFLRHEGITDMGDLLGIERDLWAVELPTEEEPSATPTLPATVLEGGTDTYLACQAEARRLRELGTPGLIAPSAALLPGAADGWRVEGGRLLSGPPRDGEVVVLFGARPELVGWCACSRGRPDPRILPKVRHLPIT